MRRSCLPMWSHSLAVRWNRRQALPGVQLPCRRPSAALIHRTFLTALLQERVANGQLRDDPVQIRAARRLDRLLQALKGYSNTEIVQGFLQKQLHPKEDKPNDNNDEGKVQEEELKTTAKHSTRIPRGLYLYGSVGIGKSMLMDTFYKECLAQAFQENSTQLRRDHFHYFMNDIHQRIHQLKQADLAKYGRNFSVDTRREHNPVVRVAVALSQECTVLCLDEFQVTDVADALILSQLFQVLFSLGTVLIATSNRPPTDLYEGGLNRNYFLPFIDLLHKHCIVHSMDSTLDYRLAAENGAVSTFFVADAKDKWVQCHIDPLVQKIRHDTTPCSIQLDVGHQRSLQVPDADRDGQVARFQFAELCQRDLGAQDYRAIAHHFEVVAVENIPILGVSNHNQARRFITLIDELYEGGVCLLCSAAAPPHRLFVVPYNSVSSNDPDSRELDINSSVDEVVEDRHAVAALASVRELSFAFRRAASRLTEMTSPRWWDSNVLNTESNE